MKDEWAEKLSCSAVCQRCDRKIDSKDPRILSVYDHRTTCMACKNSEERRTDYGDVSKQMIGQCLIHTETQYADPEGYCFHHFYPYKC